MDKLYFPAAVWCDIIILESDGHFAMIDTGTAGHFGRISEILRQIGAEQLDFILITHYHCDHYGSCVQLIKEFPTDAVYVKQYGNRQSTDGDGKEIGEAERAAEWESYLEFLAQIRENSRLVMIYPEMPALTLGSMRLRVYNTDNLIEKLFSDPVDNEYYGKYICNENTNSAMVYVESATGASAFLAGDCVDVPMTYAAADHVIERAARDVGHKVDVYKIPHHGCGDHTSEVTAGILRPDFALVTCVSCDGATLGRLSAANPAFKELYCVDKTHVFTMSAPGRLEHSEI